MARDFTFDPRTIGCRCDECPLGAWHRKRGTFQPVRPEGPANAALVLIGEHPGTNEVRQGRPMIGPSGQLLERSLNRLGVVRSEVLLSNAILCAVPGDELDNFNSEVVGALNERVKEQNKGKPRDQRLPKVPTPQEACRPHVTRLVDAAADRKGLLVALGKLAYWSITGRRAKITKVRGSFGEYVRLLEGPKAGGLVEPKVDIEALLGPQPRIRVVPSVNPAMAMREAPWREVLHRDLERALRWHRGGLQWEEPKLVTINPSADFLGDWLSRGTWWSWDLETTYGGELQNKLRTIGIYSIDRMEGVVIPWVSIDGKVGFADGDVEGRDRYGGGTLTMSNPGPADWTESLRKIGREPIPYEGETPWWRNFHQFHYSNWEGREIRRHLGTWFTNEKQWKVGHYAGYFDTRVVARHLGVPVVSGVDQILLARIWNSELPRSLYFVGTMLTDVPAWKAAEDDRKISHDPRSYRELAEYNNVDNAVVAKTAPVLIKTATDEAKWPIAQLDHRVEAICDEMRCAGLYVHEETRAELESEYRVKSTRERKIIAEIAGVEFNPGSTKQLGELLYDKWRLPIPLLTKRGKPSTSEDAIRILLTTPGPQGGRLLDGEKRTLVEALWRGRGWTKALSTVLVKLRRRSQGGVVYDDGILRPDYGSHIPATGRMSSGGEGALNCFDGATEILTERGWFRFDELPKDVKCAQYNKDTGEVDFADPLKYYEAQHTGHMVHVESMQIDLFMTPNHRCLLRRVPTHGGGVEDGPMVVVEADDYPDQGYLQYHTGRYAGGPGLFGGSVPMLQLIMAIQADGSWSRERTGVNISLKKERKIERLRMLLAELGVKHTEHKYKNGVIRFFWRWSENVELQRNVAATLGEDKLFGPWVLQLNREQLDAFVEELWHWDGCFTRKSQYSSSDRRSADWAQAVIAITGHQRSSMRLYHHNPKAQPNWVVDVSTKAYSRTANRKLTRVPWDDKVYCVSMPQHYIIVRRNGKVMVTGQTQNIEALLRRIIRPRPGHVFIISDYDQIELRLMAGLAGVQSYLDAFARGDDPHAVTALLIYGQLFQDAWDEYKKTHAKVSRYTNLRRFAKTFVYAVIYGGGEATVYENVSKATDDQGNLLFPNMTFGQVAASVRNWMRNAPEVPLWWDKVWRFVELHGYVEEPILGRRRHMPVFLRNEALNMPVQGAAAIIMSEGLLRLRARFTPDLDLGIGIVNQMHDAVTVEVPEDQAEEAAKIVTETLTCEYPKAIPGIAFTSNAKVCLDFAETEVMGEEEFEGSLAKLMKETAKREGGSGFAGAIRELTGRGKDLNAQYEGNRIARLLGNLEKVKVQA